MTPRFDLKFYEAWRAKGIFDTAKQWHAWRTRDDRAIVTVWHTDLLGGASEVVPDGSLYRYAATPGAWARTPKGKGFIMTAEECARRNECAEVILLAGMRHDEGASEFCAAAIEPALFHLQFTLVLPNGTMRGVFIPKEQA